MERQIRWGIVGSGRISTDFVMCIQMLPPEENKVTVVVDRNVEDAKKFAEKFSIEKCSDSFTDISENPEIDIVYIGTIHPCHFEHAKMMLQAGRNVLCEKPMTLNHRDTKELIDLAKEKNIFFMEGLWSRFYPVYYKLREELAAGTIGDVEYLSTHFGYPLKNNLRSTELNLGGGALMDLGLYGMSMALQVFKEEPKRIVASAAMKNGVDYASSVTLYFSNNRVAQINNHTGVMTHNNTNIAGTNGKIEVIQMWCPTDIVVNGERHHFALPEPPFKPIYPNGQGMTYEVQEVRQCLLKGLKEHPLAPLSDSLKISRMLDEAKKQIGLVYEGDA